MELPMEFPIAAKTITQLSRKDLEEQCIIMTFLLANQIHFHGGEFVSAPILDRNFQEFVIGGDKVIEFNTKKTSLVLPNKSAILILVSAAKDK